MGPCRLSYCSGKVDSMDWPLFWTIAAQALIASVVARVVIGILFSRFEPKKKNSKETIYLD